MSVESGHPAWYSLREGMTGEGLATVERLVRGAGIFTNEELGVAMEVAEECLARGSRSGYHFLWCCNGCNTIGFCCFGPVPLAPGRFELYWIVVDRAARRKGIASLLIESAEQRILNRGGSVVYLDTSSRGKYLPARRLYEKKRYRKEAVLRDFYAVGDHRIIYCRKIGRPGMPREDTGNRKKITTKTIPG